MQDSTNVQNVQDVGSSFQEELKGYLLDLLGSLKEGGEFVMEQLPMFVTEYLNWSIASHSIGFGIGLILLYIGYRAGKFIYQEYPKREDGMFYDRYHHEWSHKRSVSVLGGLSIIASVSTILTGVPLAIVNLFQLVKVLVAPRVYLIENLMHLIQ